jgi:hypothetical protein
MNSARDFRIIALALFTVLMIPCPLLAQEPVPATPTTTTAAPATTTEGAVQATSTETAATVATAEPADGSATTATVIIYRLKSMMGMALHPTVMLDGKDLINIANGTVWKGEFTPGHYNFQMDDKKSGAELDLAAGKTYYMKIELVAGMWKGGGRLSEVTESQATKDIKPLRPLPEDEIEHPMFKKK